MRTISAEMQAAILDKKSSRMVVKATIDPSRTFFETPSSAYNYDAGDYSVPTDTPIGQCMLYSANLNKVFTFIVDSSTGGVVCMADGSAVKNTLTGITANPATKPSALDLGNGTAKLYYWNNSPSELKVSTIDLSSFAVSGIQTIAVGSLPSTWTITAGSPTVIDSNRLILCYKTSKGGLGIAIKIGSFWKHWNQRFISPNALTETHWSIYTSAVVFNGKFFIYSTDVNEGNVRAVEYDEPKGSWSDIFVALPADLSRFDITNAIVVNGYVHLAGQFHRTEDYSDAKVYSLILRSSNGKNFSWDRFTMLSNIGYQFQIDVDTGAQKVYASDRNSVGSTDMSYFFASIPTHRIELEPPNSIISFSTSDENATMRIASDDEAYITHQTMKKGNRVIAEIGYKTIVDTKEEYVKYGTYIIDKIDIAYADGKRGLVLNLINEGLWKTKQIAFPFYAELLSKTSLFDDCDAQDRMYVQSCFSGNHLDYMTIDFWNSDEWDGEEGTIGGVNYSWCGYPQSQTSEASNDSGVTDQLRGRTVKLNAHPHMSTYPTITGTVTAKLYGWETGQSSGRANNTFTLYAITAPEDDLEDITVTTGVKTSTYQKFPKEEYAPSSVGSADGSYPIEFSFTGITVGHKLLYFGITASNTTTGTSTMNLERIEVHDGVKFFYSKLTSSTPWSLEKPDGEDRSYLVSPDTSLQNLMFTTKPYSAFNFNVAAEFGYSAGASDLSPGTTAWGVVGLAKDGQDYICARYKKQSSKIELLLFRDGASTLLASYSIAAVYDLMLDHRNGLIRVWYKTTDTWIGPIISYSYDEITHGVISTSETGIMHTGVYSAIYPPSFLAAAFAQPYSDGICMTTDQEKDVLAGFPNSGYVLIDGVKYKYASKSTAIATQSLKYGPIQLRQISDIGTWYEAGTKFEGVGVEIALYKPTNSIYTVKDLLLGQSNHHNWLISQSDWTVQHSTAGQPDYLRTRSKHYSDNEVHANYYHASISDKAYIHHGLKGITIEADQPYMHPNGSLCSIWSTDKIWVKRVVATQVDHDATVEDMLKLLCHTASVEAQFPGDWTATSINVTTTPTEIASSYDVFPGGLDLRFTMTLSADEQFLAIDPVGLTLSETETVEIGIKRVSGKICVYVKPSGTTPTEYVQVPLSVNKEHNYRVLIHDDFVSFYGDDQSLATLALGKENLEWDEDPLIIKLSADANRTITNVEISELFDWREAIYVESEMAVSSAISSVIQERPIEIYSMDNGDLSFSYKFSRDEITYTTLNAHNILRKHVKSLLNSDNAGSDAMIYYAEIAFVSNDNYAINDGFNTRVFRLPSLESGAKLAGEILLEKAYDKQTMHYFEMRPDLRAEVGDIIHMSYTVSGTETLASHSCIIESINIQLEEGRNAMNITARGA